MRKTPDTRKIGMFTIAGISLFFALIVISVGDKLFVNEDNLVVLFFEESIKGLSVGSPVVFKGVEIGKVISINLDISHTDKGFKIPVVAQLSKFYDDDNFKGKDTRKIMEYFVEQGLRAKLTSQNMLTGQLMISLDFAPETPVIYRADGVDKKYVEIPTMLSQLAALTKDFRNIPISEIMHELDTLLKTLNTGVPVLLGQVTKFTTDLNAPANTTLSNDNFIGNANQAIQNISGAARSLRIFADYIERNPQALLMGKGK